MSADLTGALPWKPPLGLDATVMPVHRWWDAVKVPVPLGDRVLLRLGEVTGAVICNPFGGSLYWLIAPGAADGWDVQQVTVLGDNAHLTVPPQHRTGGLGPHWRVPLAAGCYLTPAAALHTTLTAAVTEAIGHRRTEAGR